MIPQFLANLMGIGRATTIDDSGELQLMQVTEGAAGSGFADRVTDNVRRVTEFGFGSVPPIDSEVVMLRRGADRSCSLIMGTSHRPSRPRDLQPGDTIIYDVRGAKVKLSADGIEVDAAGLEIMVSNASKATLDVPDVYLTGNLHVAGDIDTEGDFAAAGAITGLTGGTAIELGALRDAYNDHGHTGISTGTATSGKTDHAV
ncbi:phage baseplate assembly protein V [Novosphingobium clariflavum]|uniref:Phage baseplate assembly protein V n=1 Tax=Novosphingobium clariflavum TaxID=2029884 RepID=A0ABV6S1J9_9SPHN|nr:phage baseplate assembly protein V [Novosphingobium clariflavum]